MDALRSFAPAPQSRVAARPAPRQEVAGSDPHDSVQLGLVPWMQPQPKSPFEMSDAAKQAVHLDDQPVNLKPVECPWLNPLPHKSSFEMSDAVKKLLHLQGEPVEGKPVECPWLKHQLY